MGHDSCACFVGGNSCSPLPADKRLRDKPQRDLNVRLQTDLAKIIRIAQEREEENWRFRSFLKAYDGSPREIDRIVHDLYQRISSEIDCQQCANCCRKIQPVLNRKDIRVFSLGLGLDINQFKQQFLVKDDETPDKFLFNTLPCPFLRGNLCLNYEHRPQDCRSFPHLHKRDLTSRLWEVVENYSLCPLVFNVYEYLKRELWHKNW